MKIKLLYLIVVLLPFFASAQTAVEAKPVKKDDLQILKSFIDDLANEEIALDVILSEYVQINEPSEDLYDYLEESLQEIRINVMAKNLKNIQYKNYQQLPIKEVKDIDPEDLEVKQMYFLYHKDRLLTSIYMENGKIASFTLVSKGHEMAHFVTY